MSGGASIVSVSLLGSRSALCFLYTPEHGICQHKAKLPLFFRSVVRSPAAQNAHHAMVAFVTGVLIQQVR